MYEVAPAARGARTPRCAPRTSSPRLVRELAGRRREHPRDDLVTDLVAAQDGDARLTEDEVVASAVLLLNAGHEASVNVFGNGLVALLRTRAAGRRPSRCRPASRRCCASTPRCSCSSAPRPQHVEVGDVTVEPGQKIAALLGAANRDPAVFDDPTTFRRGRDPNPHLAFGAGVHFCLGAPLARMELVESLRPAAATAPRPARWPASPERGAPSCCAASRRSPWASDPATT